jgi:hypothetical protein
LRYENAGGTVAILKRPASERLLQTNHPGDDANATRAEGHCHRSNRDPLDFIECDLIAGAIVELGGARAFVRRHGLCGFQGAAGFEVGGDPGGPECVAADLDLHAEFRGAALDHAPGVDPVSSNAKAQASW